MRFLEFLTPLNTHAGISKKASNLMFALSLHPDPYFVSLANHRHSLSYGTKLQVIYVHKQETDTFDCV